MKSPLKDKPLRNPGDSVQTELDNFLFDKVLFYHLFTGGMILIAIMDWYRYLTKSTINPWLFTSVATCSLLFTIYKKYKAIPTIKSLRLGRDGERVVGQYLETLRALGAKVFHDIQCGDFNLDHVVIAPSGIYVIETKTYSKPDKGEPTITFDGERVSLREKGSYDAPVIQVKSGASWLKELLKNSTGKTFSIRPVLVFPGWFVQPTVEAKQSDVWVLNPKALPTFISNSNKTLSSEDVSLVAYHLSRYVRTYKD